MLLHHHGPNGSRDVEVDVSDSDATIADLAAALDPAAPSPHLTVDGRIVPPTVPLDRAPIGRGSTISTVTVADATTPTAAVDAGACSAVLSDRPVVAVSVIRGLDAGRSWLLPTGTFVLGRKARFPAAGRRDDPQHLWTSDRTVSGSQVELRVHGSTAVEVTDLGSENGTWLGDRRLRGKDRWRAGVEMRCGAAVLRLEPVRHPSAQPIALGAPPWPWHRRPTGVGVDPAPSGRGLLVPPDDVEPTPVVTPVGVFAVVASAAVGAVMVLVLGSWTYAAFALLGPLTMVAGSLDGRIRRRRTRRRGGRARRIALEQFVEALRSRREADLTELDAAHPGVHTAVEASGARLGCLHDVPAAALWSRRRDDPVAPLLRLGTGPTSWTPPVTGEVHGWAADVTDAVDGFRTMDSSPVVLDVRRGPLAIVGPPEACRAVLRSLLIQATTLRGPADLRVGGILDPDTADDWAWMRWLPHASDPTVGDLLTAGGTRAGRIVDLATSHPQTTDRDGRLPPDLIVVVEDEKGLRATRGASRSLLRLAESRPSVCPILLLRSRAEAPQTCTIVEVGADGTLTGPPWLLAGTGVAEGTAADVASAAARSMGRFLDPEADDPGAGLPGSVPLLDLLGGAELNAEGIAARWRATGVHPAPLATLGRTAVGPLTVDLASDGPHALIAGTTGAGKSELLRTLIASLALRCSPRHVNFLLVDFKGGSAFDACDRLPHTAGIVTDLDGHLAARALRCLEAELRHRERFLREAGAMDLEDHGVRSAQNGTEPLPRLVVVIDEFATLATELPGFVDALVGVAQRGRSLGVHLVLATQRPAGSVSDNIRANTALRIALRVQDEADSTDVVGTRAAADLPRATPGRAVVRLGPRDLVTAQTAWTGGRSGRGGSAVGVRHVRIARGTEGEPPSRRPTSSHQGPNDLERIVAAVADAWALDGGGPVRRPWPDPLPAELDLTDLREGATGRADQALTLGLADDPDEQALPPYRWEPTDGTLLVVGRPGSGTTTALTTTVLAAAQKWSASELHVHIVDMGAGDLLPLAGLPQVGAVIAADERERQRRLIADLAADLAARRADPHHGHPRRLLIVDGIGAFHEHWDELDPSGTWPRFVDVVSRGAEVGIHAALAANGAVRLPVQLVSACTQRLVLELADPADAAAFGITPGDIPDLTPGRGIDPNGTVLVQLGRHHPNPGAAVAAVAAKNTGDLADGPRPVATLPSVLPRSSLPPASIVHEDGGIRLVVGVSDLGLVPASLVLAPGGHAIVAGPHRSGRSSVLRSVAAAGADAGCRIVVVGGDPWDQRGVVFHRPDDPDLPSAVDAQDPLLVLVDDADTTAADHSTLASLVRERRPFRHVVAAVRSDRARTAYSHWLREVRVDRCGILLRPDADLDGELTGSRIPRDVHLEMVAGRGWLVGDPEGFVQVALP